MNDFFLIIGSILVGSILRYFSNQLPFYVMREDLKYLYDYYPKACKIKQFKKRYYVFEVLSIVLTFFVIKSFGYTISAILLLILGWLLLLLASIDVEYQLLPDVITLTILWVGLMANSFHLFISPAMAIWGVIYGYGSIWMFGCLFKLITHVEGIGQGDFKLIAALGAWWGIKPLILIVFIASCLGSTAGLMMKICQPRGNQDSCQMIPFGFFLTISVFIVLVYSTYNGLF
ncbi:MAG: A24 family peptidase [Gammaproteobacteria bacterium]